MPCACGKAGNRFGAPLAGTHPHARTRAHTHARTHAHALTRAYTHTHTHSGRPCRESGPALPARYSKGEGAPILEWGGGVTKLEGRGRHVGGLQVLRHYIIITCYYCNNGSLLPVITVIYTGGLPEFRARLAAGRGPAEAKGPPMTPALFCASAELRGGSPAELCANPLRRSLLEGNLSMQAEVLDAFPKGLRRESS